MRRPSRASAPACAARSHAALGRLRCVQCNENIPSSVLNRLIKEVKEYTKAPVSDIKLQVNEENVTDLRAEISGPGAFLRGPMHRQNPSMPHWLTSRRAPTLTGPPPLMLSFML